MLKQNCKYRSLTKCPVPLHSLSTQGPCGTHKHTHTHANTHTHTDQPQRAPNSGSHAAVAMLLPSQLGQVCHFIILAVHRSTITQNTVYCRWFVAGCFTSALLHDHAPLQGDCVGGWPASKMHIHFSLVSMRVV